MKSIIFVLIWSILLTSFGIYSNSELNKFTQKFEYNVTNIEKSIKSDKWNNAKNELLSFSKDYHNEKDVWYRLLDHAYFDDICLYLCILEDSIYLKDKTKSLEQIEYIKSKLGNVLESGKFDINHIF